MGEILLLKTCANALTGLHICAGSEPFLLAHAISGEI